MIKEDNTSSDNIKNEIQKQEETLIKEKDIFGDFSELIQPQQEEQDMMTCCEGRTKENNKDIKNTDTVNDIKYCSKTNIEQIKIDFFDNSCYVEIKQFHGKVIAINNKEKSFSARLVNMENKNDVLIGEFTESDIEQDDMSLYKVGAIFIWIFGKEKINGTLKKFSKIQFRKLLPWREKDIKRILEFGKKRAINIRNNSSK